MPQNESIVPGAGAAKHLLWALVAITAAGAVARMVVLSSAPPALHFDEAVYGLMARQIGPGFWPVFFPAYTGREPLYMYLMAGVFKLLGSSDVTLRLTSALIGTATIPALYLLGRELYDRRTGLLAAAVLAGNYWHLSMSRNGYPNILIPPLECLALLMLWRGYRDRRPWHMALGGAAVGLVLYTYLAARLFPVTLFLFGIYVLIVDGRRMANRAGGLGLAVLAAALVFAPLGLHFYHNPHDFVERASQVLVFESSGGWSAWLGKMGTNYVLNLGALFVRGDPRPMFNLPGKPVLTPVLALFFVLGLAIALRRLKRPEYGLLPIWLLGMCLPAVLTDDIMPQSQRMSGTLPAIALLVAMGLSQTYGWLAQRSKGRTRLPLLLVLLLVAEGAHAVYTYFGVWARLPENYYHFDTPYQAAAADASIHLRQGDTVVVLAEHYRHPTAIYREPAMVDALWLVQHRTLVVPYREQGRVFIYWPRNPRIKQPFIEQRLDSIAVPVRRVLDVEGRLALGVYELRAEAVAESLSLPAAASVGEIEVLDWSVPGSAPRDQVLPVDITWRVVAGTTEGRVFSVHLVDVRGRLWSQHTDLGFMPEQWRPGDTVYQRFEVPLPEGIPAGTYALEFVLADSAAVPLAVSQDGKGAGFGLDLGSVQLTAEGGSVREPQPGTAYGDVLRLVDGSDLGTVSLRAPALDLDLTWQAADQPAEDYAVEFVLADGAGEVVMRQALALAGDYGTAAWQPGELVHVWYTLEWPDLVPGDYRLSVLVPGLEGEAVLATISVEGSLRSYTVPEMAFVSGARFGPDVELLGYDLDTSSLMPGGSLALTLYWRAQHTPATDAKVFVHLADASGQIRAQVDAVPVQWQRPTVSWLAGEVLADEYTVQVPEDAPAGEYTVYVGLYDAVTFARWAATDPEGRAVPDERYPLAAVTLD